VAERWVDGGLWIVCPDTAGVHVRADRSLAGVRLVHDRRPRVGRGRPTEDPWSRRCHGFVAAWAARLLELDAAVQFGWLATLMHDTGPPQRTAADHPGRLDSAVETVPRPSTKMSYLTALRTRCRTNMTQKDSYFIYT